MRRLLAVCTVGYLLCVAVGGCGDGAEIVTPPETGGAGPGGSGGQGGGGAGGCEAPCGFEQICCADGEECVNNYQCLPACENERCGDNLSTCCDAGQICLDGTTCAASCLPEETLCGAAFDVCCGAGDVCLQQACVTPGDPCVDIFDCPDDWYCEASLGQCLPLPTGEICEGEPTFNPIDPALEWYLPGVVYEGLDYRNTIAAPTVGDVNGDGTPDVVLSMYAGTSSANTLLVVLDGAGDGQGGGQILFTIPNAMDPSAPRPFWAAAAALGNFDADPGLEIVYNLAGGGVRIADNDGVGDLGQRTSGPADTTNWGGPSLADLNHDGTPDVVVRCHALDGTDISDPAKDLVDQGGCGENTVVADLNQDGLEEIIDANRAFTADPNNLGGTAFWSGNNGIPAGFLAVADLLPDVAGPEVINVRSGLYVLDGQTGAVLIGPGGSVLDQAIPIPGAGDGGAPTVADFDGDGLVEVSTAGQAAYVVYDPDCANPPLRAGGQCASNNTDLTLWSTTTQDISSSRTGSSVFDFQGDGAAEVLYNDECFFHIYDGTTGQELLNPVIPGSSRTAAEYPLVADVDGDGNAEMIVIGNSDQARNRDDCDSAWKAAGVSIDWLCQYTDCTAGSACDVNGNCPNVPNGSYIDAYQCDMNNVCQLADGTHGVRVYGDSFDSWVKTRPVWNQFAYHVTNMQSTNGVWDVPTTEAANWLSFNNYRQNVQGGVLFPVPDLSVELVATPQCPAAITLVATVSNEGSAGAPPGVEVGFFRTDAGANNPPELIGTATTTTTILPGGTETVSVSYANPPADVTLEFQATTDPNDLVEECDERDNAAQDQAECNAVPQ
ncbi:MAG: CARDB domain-containing protein [Polyangiaceae bacterium]